jgi:cytochrome c-type biogenesis protein CcmF
LPSILSAAAFILDPAGDQHRRRADLFGLRAGTVTEGERFSVTSREGALVFNNVMLSGDARHRANRHALSAAGRSDGCQGFGRAALFQPDERGVRAVPMLVVMAVGPLLRWRRIALSGYANC